MNENPPFSLNLSLFFFEFGTLSENSQSYSNKKRIKKKKLFSVFQVSRAAPFLKSLAVFFLRPSDPRVVSTRTREMDLYSPFEDDDESEMDLDVSQTQQTTQDHHKTTTTSEHQQEEYNPQQPQVGGGYDMQGGTWNQDHLQNYYSQYYQYPANSWQGAPTYPQQQDQQQQQHPYYDHQTNGGPAYLSIGNYPQQQQQGYQSYPPSEGHLQHQQRPPPPPPQQQQQQERTPDRKRKGFGQATTTGGEHVRFKLQKPKRFQTQPPLFDVSEEDLPPPPPKAPPPPPPNPPSDQSDDPDSWPPSLKRYIERGFEKCQTSDQRSKMETLLMEKISTTIQNGSAWTINWDKEGLPKTEVEPTLEKILGAVQKKKLSKKQKKKEKEMMSSFPNTEEEKQKVNERKNRFKTKRTISITRENEPARVIVGTCASLEKKYFRLTTAPDPSQIRPEYVLKDAVEMLKEKWKSRTTDYAYICEQFKSIRQDLTVQHIRNAFTIKVYEMHARIAIEKGDVGEFNQCQTQLSNLYASGLEGKNRPEFTGYSILYFSFKKSISSLSAFLKKIPQELRNHPDVQYALRTHRAYVTQNYYRFFKLYQNTPHLNSFVVLMFLDQIRLEALQVMTMAYRKLPTKYIQSVLSFHTLEECIDYLISHGGSISEDQMTLSTKESSFRSLLSDRVGGVNPVT